MKKSTILFVLIGLFIGTLFYGGNNSIAKLTIDAVEKYVGVNIINSIITGGSINNTSIGDTTPAAGSFTTLGASTDPVDANGVGDRGFNDARYLDTAATTKQRFVPATLTDTTSPHDLTIAECSNSLITTQGWNGTDDITFNLPDISSYDGSEGVLWVKFEDDIGMQDADTDMYVDPDASTQIVLDGTPTGTDGHRIWWNNITIYSGAVCHSNYSLALGGFWVCDSLNGLAADKGS